MLSSVIWLIIMSSSHKIFDFEGGAIPWIEIVVGSLLDYFSQMLKIFMMQSMNPAVVGMFSYVKVFYAFLSDIFIFHMSLSTMQLVGCIAVFIFSLAAAYQNKRESDRLKALEDEDKITEASASQHEFDEDEDFFKRT